MADENQKEDDEKEAGGKEGATSLACASAQSVMSLIPAQELEELIAEVKDLDEETLKVRTLMPRHKANTDHSTRQL